MAICYPLKYAQVFTMRTTTIIIGVVWLLCLALGTPYHFDGCGFSFRRQAHAWCFDASFCGYFQSIVIDFAFTFIAQAIMLGMDTYVVFKMRTMNTTPSQRKRKQEKGFFIQKTRAGAKIVRRTISPVVRTQETPCYYDGQQVVAQL
ncbi:hypothetical protein Tcan_12154 [Toxocara canis]|uniref:G-protein coupled receptors family 1 profile domain-containing protein n=1 Tax=Toxocara canis TaxID=6265 RepID=A0A0B2UTZ3_TOXCA|nr:hypothetical protein Tcan_12154 [Toxocara canis]